MKLLRVIASMDPVTGGPCQGIRYSIPNLHSEGCLNEVVCLDDPSAPFFGNDPFVIHALGRSRGPLRYHSALLPWLEKNLGRFDAVIVHGLWLWPSIATWMAIQKLRKQARSLATSSGFTAPLTPSSQLPTPKTLPYFVMPHGMLDPWFQKEPGRRWKAVRNCVYWRLVERRVIRDAAAVLFTCDRELELARTTFPLYAPNREINVGYGVPDPPVHTEEMDRFFHKSCPALTPGQPYLLFLGRIHPKKGVDLLIRAYAEVYGSMDSPANALPALVIAGPIDSDYAQEMIRLADELLPGSVFLPQSSSEVPNTYSPLPMNRPAIHFTGMLQGESKWGALYRCEAFILPSHQENFGIAVAETLSCGRPVLISDKVNIFREVEAARAGLVTSNDLEGVTSLLQRWVHLEDLDCHEMARNAERLFHEQFHNKTTALHLLKVLKQVAPELSFS